MTRLSLFTAILTLGLLAIASPRLQADERAFTFTYETTVMPAGTFEFEQWVTWKSRKENDKEFDRLDFREEFEFGLTDVTTIAFYLDSRYEDGRGSADDVKLEFRNIAVEVVHQLAHPNRDDLGVGLYGEVKLGSEIFELEGKILIQKNIGKWILAWNGIVELEWEGERYEEDKMVLAQTVGASYQVSPSLAVGAELVHELERDDFARWEKAEVSVGPAVSYRSEGWWVTTTFLRQVSDVDGAADNQLRMILGIDF